MLTLLRFILIFFLLVFLISYVVRLLLRFYLKRMEKRFNQHNHYQNTRPEGDVSFTRSPKAEKKVDKDVGDYVDYEELKD